METKTKFYKATAIKDIRNNSWDAGAIIVKQPKNGDCHVGDCIVVKGFHTRANAMAYAERWVEGANEEENNK